MTHKNSISPFRTCNFARWTLRALLLAGLCLLTACALDGGDAHPASTAVLLTTSATPTSVGGNSTAPAYTAPATAATSTGSSQTPTTTCSLTAFQAAVMAEVNRRRASPQSCGSRGTFAATGSLRWNDTLFRAAAQHSQDMVAHQFFSHTGSDGSGIGTRVSAVGYAWASVAENIAAGQPTVTRVVDAWMGSDGHCANLMNPAMQEFAVACVYNNSNRPNYWAMALAKPR